MPIPATREARALASDDIDVDVDFDDEESKAKEPDATRDEPSDSTDGDGDGGSDWNPSPDDDAPEEEPAAPPDLEDQSTEEMPAAARPEEPPPAPQEKPKTGSPPGPPPLAPPPLSRARKRTGAPSPIGGWAGRALFDDLFVVDESSLPAMGVGLHEKVDFFREKLKLVEARISKFREAWAVRDKEIDTLEALFSRERGRGEQTRKLLDAANENLTKLQDFIEGKKKEFTAYGEKATALINELHEKEKSLRHELEKLKRDSTRENLEAKEQLDIAKRELGNRNKALKKLKKIADTQKAMIAEREEQIESLVSEAESSSEQAARLRESDEETQVAIQRRDDAIRKLKMALKNAKARLQEIEDNQADRNEEYDEVAQRGQEVEEELSSARTELREVNDELAEAKQLNEELEIELAKAREEGEALRSDLSSAQESSAEPNQQAQARLVRTLGVATKLTDDLEDRTEEIVAELFEAGGEAGSAPDDVGEILRRIRKALGIALRVVEEGQ